MHPPRGTGGRDRPAGTGADWLGTGSDWLGTGSRTPGTTLVNPSILANLQVTAIVVGHVCGVVLAQTGPCGCFRATPRWRDSSL